MNIIILTGRLTRDPELKFGQSGKATELLEKYELTAAKLVAMVKENM